MADERINQKPPEIGVIDTPKGTAPIPDPGTGLPPKAAVSSETPAIPDNSTPQNAPGKEIKPEVAPEPIPSTEAQPGVPEAPKTEKKKPHPLAGKPSNNPDGVPTKKDPLTLKKLEEVFALDGTVREACFYAGISEKTYYNWVKEDPELLQRFEALRETPVLAARERVIGLIKKDSDGQNARWYLEKKRKSEFGTKIDVTSGDEPLKPGTTAEAAANAALAAFLNKGNATNNGTGTNTNTNSSGDTK